MGVPARPKNSVPQHVKKSIQLLRDIERTSDGGEKGLDKNDEATAESSLLIVNTCTQKQQELVAKSIQQLNSFFTGMFIERVTLPVQENHVPPVQVRIVAQDYYGRMIKHELASQTVKRKLHDMDRLAISCGQRFELNIDAENHAEIHDPNYMDHKIRIGQ